MSLDLLRIKDIRTIRDKLKWTKEDLEDEKLWLAKARTISHQYNLTEKDILDIVHNRISL